MIPAGAASTGGGGLCAPCCRAASAAFTSGGSSVGMRVRSSAPARIAAVDGRAAAAAGATFTTGAAVRKVSAMPPISILSPSASCCTPYTKLPLRSVPVCVSRSCMNTLPRAVDRDARVALGGALRVDSQPARGASSDVDLGPVDDERLALPPHELQHRCHVSMLADRAARGKAGWQCPASPFDAGWTA